MAKDELELKRKAWNSDHAVFRKLLEKDRNMPKASALFIRHHAEIHSAKLGANFSIQDATLAALTENQMRAIVSGQPNSVVWMIWHMTRIEDAAINVVLAGKDQVFDKGKWQVKINSPFVDVGNEMTAAEIRLFSDSVDIKALLAYRLAVGRQTDKIARTLKGDDLFNKPDPKQLLRLLDDGTMRPSAHWILDYWGSHPKANLLQMPASRHAFVHFNEIGRMMPKLRRIGNHYPLRTQRYFLIRVCM